jgi:hypothetical protein
VARQAKDQKKGILGYATTGASIFRQHDGATPARRRRQKTDRRRDVVFYLSFLSATPPMSLSIAKFPYKPSTVVLGLTASIALYQVVKAIIVTLKTTRLHGPPADSFVFGMAKQLANTREQVEIGEVYESWAREYGSAFTIRGPLGTRRIVLFDAKAIAHVCGLDTWKYAQTPIATRLLSNIVSLFCTI